MRALEQRYDGKVKIVRINVDSPEARPYLGKYQVRATPTFVFFDKHGKAVRNVPGWLGEDQVAKSFDALIAQP